MPQFKQFPLPDTGEGLTEAEILAWKVQPGDTVSINQIIVEIETAKAAVELPCPFAGVVTELLVNVGDTVDVGTPIIVVDVDPEGAASTPNSRNSASSTVEPSNAPERIANLVGYGPRTSSARRRPRKTSTTTTVSKNTEVSSPVTAASHVPLAKPPIRKLAKDLGVDLREISGSGHDGVITRADVEQAAGAQASSYMSTMDSEVDYDPKTRERRVAIRGVRKATAQAMVNSAFTAPHVTEFLAVDVTALMELKERLATRSEFANVKLTPLAFAAKAVCLAIRNTPDVNAYWDDTTNEIVYKSYVHLGIAAATPRGLVVPKVRDADSMSLRSLALAITELTHVAREGKTQPAQMLGGTFTITNVGVFGIDAGTPIINPGESAILALGAIRDMPWVVNGQVVPRKICQLALSFDHRVVDGQQGSQFLADVGALLADPALAFAS